MLKVVVRDLKGLSAFLRDTPAHSGRERGALECMLG
jgi:hypothetical protein